MEEKKKGEKASTKPKEKEKKLPPLKKVPHPRISNDENNNPVAEGSTLTVRHAFQKSLSKLYTGDTRERGMKEIRELWKKYNSSEFLGVYLSVLSDSKKVNQINGKESEILMIAYLCEVYGDSLIDTREPAPSLVKTASRVVDLVVSNFNIDNNSVQLACARALVAVNAFSLKGLGPEKRKELTIKTLSNLLLSGIDKSSQHSAAVVFHEFVQSMLFAKDYPLLEAGIPEISATFLKVPVESMYFEVVSSVRALIENTDFNKIKPHSSFNSLLRKLLLVLTHRKQGLSNLNNHMVESLNTLAAMAQSLWAYNFEDDKGLLEALLIEIDRNCKDRVVQVQVCSKRALKSFLLAIESDPSLKQKFDNSQKVQSFLTRLRDKSQENLPRNHEEKSAKPAMNADIFNLVERTGWSAHVRAQKFVKKGSGVGGGYFKEESKKSKSPTPREKERPLSTEKEREKLREFIKISKSKAREKPANRFFLVEDKADSENEAALAEEDLLKGNSKERGNEEADLVLREKAGSNASLPQVGEERNENAKDNQEGKEEFMDIFGEEETRAGDQSLAPALHQNNPRRISKKKQEAVPKLAVTSDSGESESTNKTTEAFEETSKKLQNPNRMKNLLSSAVVQNKAGRIVNKMKENMKKLEQQQQESEASRAGSLSGGEKKQKSDEHEDEDENKTPLNAKENIMIVTSNEEEGGMVTTVPESPKEIKNMQKHLKLNVQGFEGSESLQSAPKSSGKFKLLVQKHQEAKKKKRGDLLSVIKLARETLLKKEPEPLDSGPKNIELVIEELNALEKEIKSAEVQSPLLQASERAAADSSGAAANQKKQSFSFNTLLVLGKAKKSLKAVKDKNSAILSPVLKELEALEVLEAQSETHGSQKSSIQIDLKESQKAEALRLTEVESPEFTFKNKGSSPERASFDSLELEDEAFSLERFIKEPYMTSGAEELEENDLWEEPLSAENNEISEEQSADFERTAFFHSEVRSRDSEPEYIDDCQFKRFRTVFGFIREEEPLNESLDSQEIRYDSESLAWELSLSKLADGDYQGAFASALSCEDDMVAIRLVARAGSCLPKLTKGLAKDLTLRLANFARSEKVLETFIRFLKSGLDESVYSLLTVEESNFLLDSLDKISNRSNHLQSAAYELYKKLYLL